MEQAMLYEHVAKLYNSNKYIECIELIGKNETNEDLNLIKAACHLLMGKLDISEMILKELINNNSNNLNAFNNLALIYIKTNKKDQAYHLLKHILNRDNTHIEALSNMAILCKDLNKQKEGLEYFKILREKSLLTFKYANDYSMLLLKAGLIKESNDIKNEYKLTYKYKIKYHEN